MFLGQGSVGGSLVRDTYHGVVLKCLGLPPPLLLAFIFPKIKPESGNSLITALDCSQYHNPFCITLEIVKLGSHIYVISLAP